MTAEEILRENVEFLRRVRLQDLSTRIVLEALDKAEEMYRYEITGETAAALHILDFEDTLDLLLERPKSFSRFGDGELAIIAGKSTPFQEYRRDLAERLKEILRELQDACYVGLDHRYFTPPKNSTREAKISARMNGKFWRETILAHCNRKRLYITSAFSCGHTAFDGDYSAYMEKTRELFRDRELIIFSGRTVFDRIEHDVFEYAASRQHVFADSKNAWSQYGEIMTLARQFPKNFTLCFILGQAATVLAYDLAQEGYMAWDIGHLAKEYDACRKAAAGSVTSFDNFFAPD